MRRMKLCKQNKGFTLVEILVALTIFGILVIAFLALFSNAFYLTLRSGDRDKQVQTVTGKLENKLASPAYTDAAVTQTNANVILTYSDGTINSVLTQKTIGTSQMSDGTQVIIEYYIPTAVAP